MIPYIDVRLSQWGRCIGRGGLIRGLGYPSRSPLLKETQGGRIDIGINDGAWEIHQHVQRLDQGEQQIIVLRYVQDKSMRETAAIIGCSASTVGSRLDKIHRRMMEWLNYETP